MAAARSPGWDPAGDGVTTLSSSERASIAEIWARVAEDFAPFDVDVTTDDPGAAAITRSGTSDPTYGVRVLVTRDAAARSAIDGCAGGCGGVAFNDVFDTPTDHARFQPAWVFPQALGDQPKYIAEAASHEVGHTFGLAHDDRTGDTEGGYYSDHAPWAPIMGASYAQPVTQWSNGAYDGATNTQDDLAIIAAGGAPLRADESSALPPPSTWSYLTGAADADAYVLRGCAGPLDARATVATVGADLDVELRLLDLTDVLLATVDPLSQASGLTASGLDARLERTLPDTPADYVLVVDGTGRDGTTPTSGYDDYGSVGAYRLSVTGCGIAAGAPGSTGVPAVRFDATTARLTWTAPTASGDSPVTSYDVLVDGVRRQTVTTTQASVAGLVRGRAYRFSVAARNAQGAGRVQTRSTTVPAAKPGAPRISRVTSGASGGDPSAHVTWRAPASNGSAITQYKLTVYRVDSRGRVLQTATAGTVPGRLTKVEARVWRTGTFRFAVQARNGVGWGPLSARSASVVAR